MTTAIEMVRRFRDLRALVIGDAMLDSYLEGTAARLCREGPVPVVRKTGEERAPGGAANAAANLRALGADVVFLGIVGTDLAGGLLRAALRARGVDDRWLVEDAGASTLHKLRVLADDQYVVRFDEGGDHFSPLARERLLAHLEDAFDACDLIVVSDYGYGAVPDSVIDRLRVLRATRPRPLVVDAKDPRRFASVGATVITPNLLEARLAVEPAMRSLHAENPPAPGEVEQIGRQLLTAIDTEWAAITLAADGVLLMSRLGDVCHLPAHRVAKANDIGAGDSFTAALALALAAGADPEEAARIGIDAASVAVTQRRTTVVSGQELLQRVGLREQVAEETQPALPELTALLDSARLAGRTIVFTNGCFDILHAGHVQMLRRAKALGDLLVVGVNSDRGVRRLKGPTRPINNERDRLALVAALDAVDYAILFDEDLPNDLIRALRPHIHVKGGDYDGRMLPEADAVRESGGRTVILPLVEGLSTTNVIDRVLELALTRTEDGGRKAESGGPIAEKEADPLVSTQHAALSAGANDD